MNQPIKLYVGENYREPKLYTHTELMFPFWGVAAKESAPFVRAAALKHQYSKNDFVLSPRIEDADYVLMPYQIDRFNAVNPEKVRMIIEEARQAGKPIIIDGAGDLERPIDVANSVVFRVSQYRYATQPNALTVPFPTEDLLETYRGGKLPERQWRAKPSVGFAGWAGISLQDRLKIFAKELPLTLATFTSPERGAEHKGLLFRKRALELLARDERIATNFIARTTYSGNATTISGSPDETRRAFVSNLAESDYALCVKGDANASVRFYEALSMGAIPLFVDTACVLPLSDRINYRDFCLFLDWRDLDRIGDRLVEFHSKLSPEQFALMRRKARETYEKYLRFDSFSPWLAAELRKRLETSLGKAR